MVLFSNKFSIDNALMKYYKFELVKSGTYCMYAIHVHVIILQPDRWAFQPIVSCSCVPGSRSFVAWLARAHVMVGVKAFASRFFSKM